MSKLQIYHYNHSYPTVYSRIPIYGNRKLIASVFTYNSTASVPAITRLWYDDGGSGVDFTSIGSVSLSWTWETTRYARINQYYLDDPPPGQTIPIKITYASTPDSKSMSVISLFNAKAGAPDSNSGTSGTGTTVSRTMSPVEDHSLHIGAAMAAQDASLPSISGYLGSSLVEQFTLVSGSIKSAVVEEYRDTSASDSTGAESSVSTDSIGIYVSNIGEDVAAQPVGGPRFFPNMC